MSLHQEKNKQQDGQEQNPYQSSVLQPVLKSKLQPSVQAKLQPAQLKVKSKKEDAEKFNELSGNSDAEKDALPEDVKTKMESSFGTDFSDVKIHKDSESSKELNAKAYTQGSDIHFSPGEFNPESQKGQELIGHELTHVVQQREGKVEGGKMQGKELAVNDDAALEKEADDAGKLASEGKLTQVKNSASNSIQKKDGDTETQPWKEVEDSKSYTVSDGSAVIRELKDGKFEATTEKILKWTEVKITRESTDGKYIYVVQTKESPLKTKKAETVTPAPTTTAATDTVATTATTTTTTTAATDTPAAETGWWTSKSNVYCTTWDPKEHEEEYKKISAKYSEQMLQNDPNETIKDLTLSGDQTKGIIDKYFKNSTDPADLDDGFKTKYEKLKKCFDDNGIKSTVHAMLRHPLRSTVFNYTIAVRDASSADIIYEANAVCKKYGIPINWAHLDKDGNLDLKESKAKAKIVSDAFTLGNNAARSVLDFGGGGISNHNHGKAIDLTLSFTFTEKKKIKHGDKEYEIDPTTELAGQTAKNLANVANSTLTQLGKAASGLTRSIDSDPIHWSESGN